MNVQYVDAESISIVFSSLVIKASSLSKSFSTIDEFAQKFDLDCKTNGKLVVIHEMHSHHSYLSEFVTSHLDPLGLKKGIDYTFVLEELFHGVEGRESFTYEGKELTDTLDVPWLNSKMTEEGCHVSMAEEENRFAYLQSLSLSELVACWNKQVGNPGWTSSRAVYLSTLKDAIRSKGVDVKGLTLKKRSVLKGNVLVECKEHEIVYKLQYPNGESIILPDVTIQYNSNIEPSNFDQVTRIVWDEERAHFFNLSNVTIDLEILTISDNQVVSGNTIVKGHSGYNFRQVIYGRNFLVIPRNSSFSRIPLHTIITEVED